MSLDKRKKAVAKAVRRTKGSHRDAKKWSRDVVKNANKAETTKDAGKVSSKVVERSPEVTGISSSPNVGISSSPGVGISPSHSVGIGTSTGIGMNPTPISGLGSPIGGLGEPFRGLSGPNFGFSGPNFGISGPNFPISGPNYGFR